MLRSRFEAARDATMLELDARDATMLELEAVAFRAAYAHRKSAGAMHARPSRPQTKPSWWVQRSRLTAGA